jgi:hypothetical protein
MLPGRERVRAFPILRRLLRMHEAASGNGFGVSRRLTRHRLREFLVPERIACPQFGEELKVAITSQQAFDTVGKTQRRYSRVVNDRTANPGMSEVAPKVFAKRVGLAEDLDRR